jgi:hypothetical protein
VVRAELRVGQHGRGRDRLVRRGTRAVQLEAPANPVDRRGEAVDGEAQRGQNLVVDDVIEEDRVRIEDVLVEDDAVGKCRFLADGPAPCKRRGAL